VRGPAPAESVPDGDDARRRARVVLDLRSSPKPVAARAVARGADARHPLCVRRSDDRAPPRRRRVSELAIDRAGTQRLVSRRTGTTAENAKNAELGYRHSAQMWGDSPMGTGAG